MTALPVARLFGFEIRLHVSWTIILALITVTVATQVETLAPSAGPVLRWTIGAIAAVLFLLSSLAHELGHAIVARRSGMPGGPVIVYFFGGSANPALDARRPRDEMASALAGPLISIAIGSVFFLAAVAGGALKTGDAGLTVVAAEVALFVGLMNLILGFANLVPAFPLDGGRIIRGIVWARTGDADAGLRAAGLSGRRVGVVLSILGLLITARFTEFATDGLMIALTGWFLVSSGRTIERLAELDGLLEGMRVGDVMDRDVTGVPPGLTLDTFATGLLDGSSGSALAVLLNGDLLGVVDASTVRRVRRDRWRETRVDELMVSGDALPRVAPETTLRSALEQLRRSGLDGLPVLEAGKLAGLVTRRAVSEAIRSRVQAARLVP